MFKLKNYTVFFSKYKKKLINYFLFKYLSRYKNIILFNAAGYNNIGDDIIAFYLKKRFEKKSSIFNIDFNNLEKVKNNLRKLQLIPINIEDVNNFYKKNTLIICGGGTIINPLVFTNDYYLEKIKKFQEEGFKVVFLGIEATGFDNKNLAKNVFLKSLFIGVRNIQTKKLILNLYNKNGKKPLIFITYDLVEHINFKKSRNEDIKEKIAGICISPKIKINQEKIKLIIDKLINKKYIVEFFSFCNHTTYPPENDLDTAKIIKEKYFKKNTKVKIFDLVNINDTINHLDNYSLIITTRLHTTIIAHIKEIPVYNINWEDKCKNYCFNNNLFNGNIDDLLKRINQL
ncbi:MAG: polysaccharide pyruvyl transferase family protein [Candidatus Omnitrophica bacterium]|nr:polysaccharide pyruvyl transferase family protein [Candidatus Omnitrophota bacterium]